MERGLPQFGGDLLAVYSRARNYTQRRPASTDYWFGITPATACVKGRPVPPIIAILDADQGDGGPHMQCNGMHGFS